MKGKIYNYDCEEFVRRMFRIADDLKAKSKRVKSTRALCELRAKRNTLRDALAIFDRTITRIQPLKRAVKESDPKGADSVREALQTRSRLLSPKAHKEHFARLRAGIADDVYEASEKDFKSKGGFVNT